MNEIKKETIDLFYYLSQFGRMLKRTWWLFIFLSVLAFGILSVKIHWFYTPRYAVSASFSVNSGGNACYSDYAASVTLDQLNATFPYILESGALKKIVCEDIGIDLLPGTITASVLDSTNLFQISVTSDDPQTAKTILTSVIENYPTVAKYIIGDTTLHMLDQSDVPSEPVNRISIREEITAGLSFSIFLYILILSFLVWSNHTVLGEEDLKQDINIRCLASIPKTWTKKRSHQKVSDPLISDHVTPAFIEAFHTLCVRILRRMKQKQYQVLLVTSCRENEGKTTAAANLALACAEKGYKTLLIDGDFRNPSLFQHLHFQKTPSSEHISSENRAKDTLQEEGLSENILFGHPSDYLDILGSKQPVMDAAVSSLLNDTGIETFLKHCRPKYDYIFIDTPPCSMMQDAIRFARYSDCALFVIRQDYTVREHILTSLELLSETGCPIIGYTINMTNRSAAGYSSDKYGYGKYGYGRESYQSMR